MTRVVADSPTSASELTTASSAYLSSISVLSETLTSKFTEAMDKLSQAKDALLEKKDAEIERLTQRLAEEQRLVKQLHADAKQLQVEKAKAEAEASPAAPRLPPPRAAPAPAAPPVLAALPCTSPASPIGARARAGRLAQVGGIVGQACHRRSQGARGCLAEAVQPGVRREEPDDRDEERHDPEHDEAAMDLVNFPLEVCYPWNSTSPPRLPASHLHERPST